MIKREWPEKWPDLRQIPQSNWPASMLAIDEELKKLIRIKVADQIPKALERLNNVLAAEGKTLDDLLELLRAWNTNPKWREAWNHARAHLEREAKYSREVEILRRNLKK